MPTPRKQQISLSDTPYYHCTGHFWDYFLRPAKIAYITSL